MSFHSKKPLRDLRRGLISHFNEDDLQVLASDLDINWHTLSGNQKIIKTQALILLLAENNQLMNLLTLLSEEKPQIDWRAMFAEAASEETVQKYINHVSHLLDNQKLNSKHIDEETMTLIKNETTRILQTVNGEEKGSIFRFLRDSGLIQGESVLDPETNNLEEVDLRGTNLLGLNLADSHLSGANLSKTNLPNADFSRADLRQANLGGANLCQANLQSANLEGAHLWGANLFRANLANANLRDAHLSGSHLRNADLWQADLCNAYLWGADLRNANLSGVENVTKKQLSLAKSIEGAIF